MGQATSSPNPTSPTWSRRPTPSSCDAAPELSVVVPVFNEVENIHRFLAGMARQQGVSLELIVSDGGSTDGSGAAAENFAGGLPFPLRVIRGEKGRALQMNRAAGVARADTLLFLHVDSSFADPLALRKGVDALRKAAQGGARVAGRFALSFDFQQSPPLPYRFYGAKAALDRPGCTHGDQGFMMGCDLFRTVGPFDASLPLMEDTILAERIRGSGNWILLPARIYTSPRRFLTEGLLPRQSLNAVLMNLAAMGRFSLIHGLRQSYRTQDAAKRLKLRPLLLPLKEEIALLPAAERREFWYRTGAYVRGNAWQMAFFMDVLTGCVKEGKGGSFLALHDRLLGRLLDNAAGNWGAAALTWLWFRLTLLAAR